MKHAATCILLALLTASPAGAGQNTAPVIAAAVADSARPETDRARDVNRKPAAVLAFAGVRSGMVVAELASGSGYYTRLLARAVGPKGKVLAVVTAAQAARPNGLNALNGLITAYPNISIVPVETYASMHLPMPADLFWTTENYHDFHNGPTANIAGLDRAVYDNLKKGGVFYVEDHSAASGAGLGATSTVHRMDEDVAKKELMDAGFKLVAEGSDPRNVSDNRAGSMSEAGHFVTDRFMLKMRK